MGPGYTERSFANDGSRSRCEWTRGAITCGEIYFDLDKELMDTGALHFSYISRDLVDKRRMLGVGRLCMLTVKYVLEITKQRSM